MWWVCDDYAWCDEVVWGVHYGFEVSSYKVMKVMVLMIKVLVMKMFGW